MLVCNWDRPLWHCGKAPPLWCFVLVVAFAQFPSASVQQDCLAAGVESNSADPLRLHCALKRSKPAPGATAQGRSLSAEGKQLPNKVEARVWWERRFSGTHT